HVVHPALAAPTITSVTTANGKTTVKGTLTSTPSTYFLLEIFASPSCDPSGAGEGQTRIGGDTITTDGSGNKSFSHGLGIAVPAGEAVTATVTNGNTRGTSEFSTCFTAP